MLALSSLPRLAPSRLAVGECAVATFSVLLLSGTNQSAGRAEEAMPLTRRERVGADLVTCALLICCGTENVPHGLHLSASCRCACRERVRAQVGVRVSKMHEMRARAKRDNMHTACNIHTYAQRATCGIRQYRATCSRSGCDWGGAGCTVDVLCMPRCGVLRTCVRALTVIPIFSAIAFEYFRCTHCHPAHF